MAANESSKKPKKKHKKRGPKQKKDKKAYYVNAKDFLAQISEYYENPNPKVERILAESICKIATGLSFAPNFINYSYKDDMKGDAIVKMFTALKNKKFNIDSGYNPFSYFTTIAFHAFINRIKKEKKHHEVVQQYRETVYDQLIESNDHMSDTSNTSSIDDE
jgi:hypothetical protein